MRRIVAAVMVLVLSAGCAGSVRRAASLPLVSSDASQSAPPAASLPASVPASLPASMLAASQPSSQPDFSAEEAASLALPSSGPLSPASLVSTTEVEDNSFLHREGFWYQFGRKATLGMMAGMNSEFLFTNQDIKGSAIDSAMIYVPSFLLMDEIIQRYNLDATSTFYLGSLYGIWLEGLIVGSISEAPGFFLTYVTTFWHGFLTTYSAAEVTENILPRKKKKQFNRSWLIAGSVALGAETLLFLPASIPRLAANPVAPVAMLGVSGLFTYLLARRIRSGEHEYKPSPWLAVGMIAAGFGLGFVHQAQQEPGEPRFTTTDHALRGGTYFTLEVGMLAKTLFAKKK